jgi:hypothetical protein
MKMTEDSNNHIYPSDLDEFMVEQGMKHSKKPGKLKYFYELEEHPGWFAFIFEHRSIFVGVEAGIALGLFEKIDDNTARLAPGLEIMLADT